MFKCMSMFTKRTQAGVILFIDVIPDGRIQYLCLLLGHICSVAGFSFGFFVVFTNPLHEVLNISVSFWCFKWHPQFPSGREDDFIKYEYVCERVRLMKFHFVLPKITYTEQELQCLHGNICSLKPLEKNYNYVITWHSIVSIVEKTTLVCCCLISLTSLISHRLWKEINSIYFIIKLCFRKTVSYFAFTALCKYRMLPMFMAFSTFIILALVQICYVYARAYTERKIYIFCKVKKKKPNGFSFMKGSLRLIIQSSVLPGAAASAFLQIAITSTRKTLLRHSLLFLLLSIFLKTDIKSLFFSDSLSINVETNTLLGPDFQTYLQFSVQKNVLELMPNLKNDLVYIQVSLWNAYLEAVVDLHERQRCCHGGREKSDPCGETKIMHVSVEKQSFLGTIFFVFNLDEDESRCLFDYVESGGFTACVHWSDFIQADLLLRNENSAERVIRSQSLVPVHTELPVSREILQNLHESSIHVELKQINKTKLQFLCSVLVLIWMSFDDVILLSAPSSFLNQHGHQQSQCGTARAKEGISFDFCLKLNLIKELSGNSYLISTVKLTLLHLLTMVPMIFLGEDEC
ncbi:hypothetical protein EK904_006592 [Melospiza melodia maxima]|nr:hypothetical protein EK904_006592 [Melospiza melodia maxima]